MLGLRCCARAFSSCGERGATLCCGAQTSHCRGFSCCGAQTSHCRGFSCCGAQTSHCRGFSCCGAQALGARASAVVARGLSSCGSRAQSTGSVVVAHGLSCSAACEIFPGQGSNPYPLHWQADSQPLHHQGSPPPPFLTQASHGRQRWSGITFEPMCLTGEGKSRVPAHCSAR